MKLQLSIDFEDFAHDLKRDLSLWETGPLRIDALWRCYADITQFLQSHAKGEGKKLTFFCTAIIAEQAPDLIAQIAKDGHEVACHYYYHDEMDQQDPETVDRMLGRAKAALEAASNTEVRGFRAPKFRIDKKAPAQYRAVERHFAYDSSFPTGDLTELTKFRQQMGLTTLKILPIYSGSIAGRRLRLGGTYLKLFPAEVARRLIAQARAASFTPHIYVHPYEFNARGDFLLNAADRKPLGARKSLYWGLRQNQWHTVGNRTLPGKLAGLIRAEGGLGGRLDRELAPAGTQASNTTGPAQAPTLRH